jgi:hypothetical protein
LLYLKFFRDGLNGLQEARHPWTKGEIDPLHTCWNRPACIGDYQRLSKCPMPATTLEIS